MAAEKKISFELTNLFKDVYNVMILAQIILTAYGIYKIGLPLLLQAVVAISIAVAVDLLIKYFKKDIRIPKSAIISGFIITNVLATNQLWVVAAFAATAMILKHIIRFEGKHIFNPANLALATLVFFLPASHGWAGAASIPLVVVLGLITIFVLKRLHLPAVFFLSYFVLAAGAGLLAGLPPLTAAQKLISDGTMFFFGFFMLTEPITSPIDTKGQIVFGVLAAVFAFAIAFRLPQFAFPLALVAADVLVPAINKYF